MDSLILADVSKSEPVGELKVLKNLGTVEYDKEGKQIGIRYGSELTSKFFENKTDEDIKTAFNHKDLFQEASSKMKGSPMVLWAKETLRFQDIVRDIAEERRKGQHYNIENYFKDNAIVTEFGDSWTLDHLFKKIGFNKQVHKMSFFIESGAYASKRYLVPEIFTSIIFTAMIEQSRYKMLCGNRSMSVAQHEIKIPEVVYQGDDMLMQSIGESETLSTVTLSFSDRSVKVYRRGIKTEINAQVMKYVNYDMLAESLQQIGWRLSNQLSDLCISILVNGDLPNLGYPVGEMGVEATANKIRYIDVNRVAIRYLQTPYLPNVVLMNEAEMNRVTNLDDFLKNNRDSSPLFEYADVNGELKKLMAVPNNQIGNNKQLFVDTRRAVTELILEGLYTETDQNIEHEKSNYYVRMATGFMNVNQQAKLMLNGDIAYSGFGFPSYLNLVK